jgi:hypothetical protein
MRAELTEIPQLAIFVLGVLGGVTALACGAEHPAIGLVLVLSVDWFIGMARALGNLIGNCIATVVIATREGDLDRDRARRVLDGAELVAGSLAIARQLVASTEGVDGVPDREDFMPKLKLGRRAVYLMSFR